MAEKSTIQNHPLLQFQLKSDRLLARLRLIATLSPGCLKPTARPIIY